MTHAPRKGSKSPAIGKMNGGFLAKKRKILFLILFFACLFVTLHCFFEKNIV